MQVVDSWTHCVVSAGNALVNGAATIKEKVVKVGLDMFHREDIEKGGRSHQSGSDTAAPQSPGIQTQNLIQLDTKSLTDPGIPEVYKVLQLSNALDLLISGGPDGGPDWDKIRGTVCFRVFLNELIADAAILRAPPILSRAGCTSR